MEVLQKPRYALLATLLATFGNRHATASLNILPAFSSEAYQSTYGLSQACVAAINTTLDCDEQTAITAAENSGQTQWSMQDLTTLCTSSCGASLQSWSGHIENVCAGDEGWSDNTVWQLRDVTKKYIQGYDLTCLQNDEGDFCLFESQKWQGRDYIRWDTYACLHEDPADNPPECEDPEFSTAQVSDDMMAVTNIYPKSLYCSDCFLRLWRQRIMTASRPGYSLSYLAEQFSDMEANCSTSLPYSITIATTTTTAASATTTSLDTLPTIDPEDCTGQVVNATSPALSCDRLSKEFNVSTGAVRRATNDFYCSIESSICLPEPCDIQKIYDGTCSELAERYSTASYNVTEQIFLSWNDIEGRCDQLPVQYVCASPPGGAFTATAAIHAPTAAGEYFTTATAPVPTEPGAIKDCGRYYTVAAGDTCQSIALRFSLSRSDLVSYNKNIDDDCSNLWLGYAVCVARVSPPKTSKDGRCGPEYEYATCSGSGLGSCCSNDGRCGDGNDYCDFEHCIAGECEPSSQVSQNGVCNETITCIGSTFGSCCSTSGYCGSTDDYCGPGNCFSGDCDPDVGGKSIDGSCGPLFAGNKTCSGTQFGACCSISGYCGDTEAYCGAGNCYSGDCAGGSTSSCDGVEVTLEALVHTEWGENVYAVGSIPELGNWVLSDAILLTAQPYSDSLTSWSAVVRIPENTGVGYKFVKQQTDGSFVWEDDPNRGIDALQCGQGSLKTGGEWNTQQSTICTTLEVTFEVLAKTTFGESVYLVGSVSEIGGWDTAGAIALAADGYTDANPLWTAKVNLPVGTAVAYKFLKMGLDGGFTWEGDPNRSLDMPDGCSTVATQTGAWQSPS